ncbi:polysaccharide biosynthesis tyrosine autokinase [Pengzhenrongella sp.]|uniref:polysaccharide biosynthesis tyrosine autokinase n=1 Tax=Pengzhenrongella sp. TaxID=2888820 RepID=UPI002F95CC6A
MELHDYVVILRKRWMSILVIATLAVAGALAATLLVTPTYQARAQVFVSVRFGGTTADLLQGSNFTQGQVKSYTDLVTSPRVLTPVIERLGLSTTPDVLAKSISADSPLDTVLINVTVTDTDPQAASDIANATAGSLGTEVTALEKPAAGQASPVLISTVRTATAPTLPASPSLKLNLALGLLVGLAVGVGLAVLREVLDTLVRSESGVRRVTNAAVIATIGFEPDAPKHPLIVQSSPYSHRSEAFRRLRTNLQFLDIADRPQSIVVTSALPGEGKSTTAINLAITLADAGSRVILVDADLRRPSVAKYMSLEGGVGLTTVLIGQASLQDVVQPWGNGYLDVLPSGQIPPNPSELLGSQSMSRLLETMTSQYDIVLIDTSPLLPVTDAAILAKLTGGALVVVGADKLHRQQLAEALGSLETVGARILGVVLNRLPRKHADGYTYYYEYASTPTPTTAAAKGQVSKAKRPARPQVEVEVPSPAHSGSRRTSRSGREEAVETIDSIFGPPVATGATRWPEGTLSGGGETQA